jgi:hypothetical protein
MRWLRRTVNLEDRGLTISPVVGAILDLRSSILNFSPDPSPNTENCCVTRLETFSKKGDFACNFLDAICMLMAEGFVGTSIVSNLDTGGSQKICMSVIGADAGFPKPTDSALKFKSKGKDRFFA